MPIRVVAPESQAFLKALIFAPHKHGKTTFVASAQEDERTSPILLLDFEGNTESLVGLDIDIAPIRSWDDFSEVYGYLVRDSHSDLPGSSLPEGGRYKTIAIDSITEVNFYALLAELQRQSEKTGDVGGERADQAQIQDYGKVLTQMRRLLRRFRDLPMHVMYTALDDNETEPGEGIIKTPMMIGAMRREVGALVSVVCYLAVKEIPETREKKRVLLLHDIPRFRIGVREGWKQWGSIPTELQDPTVGRLLDAIPVFGGKKPALKVANA